MTVGPISAAGIGQSVLLFSNSNQLQQTLQSLQNNLAAGDLSGSQSAFQSLRTISQNLANASGKSSNNSQFSTDLTALGSALSAGDLATAQSALATVQNDLKNGNSPLQTNEISAASQSEQFVSELLSSLNVNSSSSGNPDLATSVLEQVYGVRNLNVQA